MKVNYPNFECKLIICGLKIIGKDHIQKEIDYTMEAMDMPEYKYLIAGYDMVNEEDTTPPIEEFAQLIMNAKEKRDGDFPCIFHAGESDFSSNTNLYDAMLIGSKRIGHGFNIALHPSLVDYAIKNEICLEVCPISNFILAYTLDLRWHPARALINQGLQISLNSDDPGFYNYQGVTLDFAYAFLAWELTVRDLK
jgi:adenosine deaminase CECR1